MSNVEEQYLVYSGEYCLTAEGSEPVNGVPPVTGDASVGISPDDKKKQYIQSFFNTNSFRHVALITGAGSSVICGGKLRDGLWDSCEETIKEIGSHFPDKLEECAMNKDIESFLSFAIQYNAIQNEEGLPEAITKVKSEIRKACTLELSGSAHEEMLKKLTARKATLPRAEIFTTNYDTLFEQAARRSGIIVIDGFSFAQPRMFSGRFFDLDIVDREQTRVKAEENYVPNVIHIHKLHGSLDWVCDGESIVQRELSNEDDPLIIYPSTDKYAESYDQPYFEMMARFQTFLRKKDCLLMVSGYGFADKHINSAIIEAVHQNPSFHLIIADFGIAQKISNGQNVNVINIDFYQKLFKEIRSNVTIVQGSFDSFVDSIPLNRAYQGDMFGALRNARGGVQ